MVIFLKYHMGQNLWYYVCSSLNEAKPSERQNATTVLPMTTAEAVAVAAAAATSVPISIGLVYSHSIFPHCNLSVCLSVC